VKRRHGTSNLIALLVSALVAPQPADAQVQDGASGALKHVSSEIVPSSCSRRILAYDRLQRLSDEQLARLESQYLEATAAAAGLVASLNLGTDAKSATDALQDLAAKNSALEQARRRARTANDDWTTQWEERAELDERQYTCVPDWALMIGTSGSGGVGQLGRWSIDLSLRSRQGPTLAIGPTLSWLPITKGLVGGSHELLAPGFEVRHGRGNTGEFFYGAGLVLGRDDSEKELASHDPDWGVAALRAQVGYSYSPAQDEGRQWGWDVRVFVEPWISIGRGPNSLLFGIGLGGGLMSLSPDPLPNSPAAAPSLP
jgi:hypothetical protein